MASSALDNVFQRVNSLKIEVNRSSWYDLWHFHPDMKGVGNKNVEARHICLQALRIAYEKTLEQLNDWNKPHQVWVIIDATDSGQDAVYIHTPNPNKQNYPYRFDDVKWLTRGPKWITQVFTSMKFRLGKIKYQGHVSYFILKR